MSSLGINSLITILETGNACMDDSVVGFRSIFIVCCKMVGYVVLVDLVVEQFKHDDSSS